MKKKLVGKLLLLFVVSIWGLAFVIQDKASSLIPPYALNAIRFFIAFIVLLPLAIIFTKKDIKNGVKFDLKFNAITGILCGIFLLFAANFQQIGIASYPDGVATSGRSGFITTIYVLIVPILGLLIKKKISLIQIIGAVLAIVGLFFLCFSSGIEGLYQGDIYLLFCALFFALQIVCIDFTGGKINGFFLAAIQFLVAGIGSFIFMLVYEEVDLSIIKEAWFPILYLGVLSGAIGYTCQVFGQHLSSSPTADSLIMSFEAVLATLFGVLISHEFLTARELIGCIIMFIAILLAQLPIKFSKKKE